MKALLASAPFWNEEGCSQGGFSSCLSATKKHGCLFGSWSWPALEWGTSLIWSCPAHAGNVKSFKSKNRGSNCVILASNAPEPQPTHQWKVNFHSICFRALKWGSSKIKYKWNGFLTEKHLCNVSWLKTVPSQRARARLASEQRDAARNWSPGKI